MRALLFFSLIGIGYSPQWVSSESPAYMCYSLDIGSPAAETPEKETSEIWCYERLQTPKGAWFIFNADNKEARPELSLLVEDSGILTHASLLGGKLSLHRVRVNQFNPFSIPIKEPKELAPLPRAALYSKVMKESVEEVKSYFITETPPLSDVRIQSGVFQEAVSESAKPWRGFWWSRKNKTLSHGPESPLGKYDRYVEAQTGVNPGAMAWENVHHRYKGVWWEGHCNGWAASSILRRQPTQSRYDSQSGVRFSVSDQKGLLAVTDYCAQVAFFGKRYRSGGNMNDIFPAEFHKTLTYYIGQLGKPVAVDYRRDSVVDNHVISAYTMTIESVGTHRYSVRAKLTIHKYDLEISDIPGIAPSYTKTYSYILTTDTEGNPTGGYWRSTNPDFLWVPLSVRDCSRNNPEVQEEWIQRIIY